MFFAVDIFVMILGIGACVLILRSETGRDNEVARIASEFEIEEINS